MTTEGSVGMGVLSEDGNDTIDNFAVLAGSVDLGRGDNRIDNRAGAVFAPGSRVDLGSAQNLVASDGILAPGATGRAQSVDLNGSYLQSGSASAETEIDFASDSIDQLVASGTVDLAGTLRVSLLNTAKIPVGDFSRILFQGRSGLVDHGMVMETVPSVVIDYDLEYVDGTTATLAYAVDFRPDGMGDNLDAVGEYINRGQVAGGGDAAYGEVITKLVYDPDLTAYRDSLSQLSPEFFGEHQVQFIGGSVDFGQRLMSCKQAGGEHRFTREGSCVWLQYDWLSMDRDAHGDYKAVSGDADRLSVGAQRTLESDWSFGFGYATEDNSFDGFDDRWTARGSADYLGLSVKRRFGPTKLSGVLSYSWNETDSVRRGTLTEPFVATSTRDMDAWTTTFRYSYDFEFENWYLRPMVDAGWMRLNMDSAREQGADAINLVFADYDEDHLWVRPAVEFGKEFALAQDYALRLNLDVGAQQYLSDDSTDVRAWLEGGRTDVAPISVPTSLGNPSYGARIGVEIFSSQGFLAQIYYAGSWYDDGDTSTTMLRFQVPVR
jgi:uncharacterized protein YhjY with autotransporter beta-barrel domain